MSQENAPSLKRAAQNCTEAEFRQFAKDFAAELEQGDRVLLEGPMGAGKSTFARAVLSALKVEQPPAGSPTFAIAHEYQSPKGEIVHIDFYRIKHEEEIDDAGIPEYFWERDMLVLAEWTSNFPQFEQRVIATQGRYRNYQVTLEFGAMTDRRNIEIAVVR